jgi:superfamily I DNA/RNA helicase
LASLTQEQIEFAEKKFDDIILLKALAGCGKTTSLIAFANKRKGEGDILYLAYNKSMANEAIEKFRALKHVKVCTIHSLAYQHSGKPYRERLGALRAKDLTPLLSGAEQEIYFKASAIIALLKKFCASDQTITDFCVSARRDHRFIKEFEGVAFPAINALADVWERVLNDASLPFEHDFYLKLYQLSGPNLDNYAYTLIDEAQDITPCMTDIVLSQKRKKAFVGDSYQQIYGWRGASSALKKLEGRKNVVVSWLTESWRCSQSVADKANVFLRALGCPKSLKGRGGNVVDNSLAFICRRTATAFLFCLEAIESNPSIRLSFVGGVKNYNVSLMLDINKLMCWDAESDRPRPAIFDKLVDSFSDWGSFKRYIDEAGESDLKSIVNSAYAIKNRLQNGCKAFPPKLTTDGQYRPPSLYEFFQGVENRIDDKRANVVISTAHRSKGLEWDEVLVADDYFDLHQTVEIAANKRLTKPEEVETEELNLLYVATTRARVKVEHLGAMPNDDEILMFRELIREGRIILR